MLGIDLITFIKAAGYLGVGGIIFAESGILLGFFLPGDTLLFSAGILAYAGVFNLYFAAGISFAAAVLGDSLGYSLGKKFGPKIFTRESSYLWNKTHLERARIFFRKYGGKTIILARFVPFARTLAPILAGVGNMRYFPFLFYNVIGAGLWAIGLTLAGFYFGRIIPNPDKYLLPIIFFVILASVIPVAARIIRIKLKKKMPPETTY